MTDHPTDYHTKAIDQQTIHHNHEIKDAFEELMRSFEEFKDANQQRLDEIEKKNTHDPLLEEKVDKINQSLDRQQDMINRAILKNQRPVMEHDEIKQKNTLNYQAKDMFNDYIRKGYLNPALNLKAAQIGTATGGGGVFVPEEVEAQLSQLMNHTSPMRQIAEVKQISTGDFKKALSKKNAAVNWVAETATRTQTTTPDIEEIAFPIGELYAMPAATQALLDDAFVNVDEWIVNEIQYSFIEKEQDAFIKGDGSNKPKGIMTYSKTTSEPTSNTAIQYLPSKHASTINGVNTLIDLMHLLRHEYRHNAAWILNRKTLAQLRKLQDDDNHHIWQPALANTLKATLFGYPVIEIEQTDDVGGNKFPIAFGDFKRGYLILDRMGVSVLRDPYSKKPYVLFYVTKRVGGGVQDVHAIKILKIATS